DAFQANIIHSHHPFLLGDTAVRIAASKHVPVIFTHHTLYEDYTHYVPGDSPALKQFAIELSTRYANLCDGVIAPSESIAELIKSRGVEVPIKVIPTGIDVKGFSSGNGKAFRATHKISPDAFVVGHLGRLAPEKNLPYLCRAICRFLKQEPKAVFLIVGEGPSEKQIRSIFRAKGLTKRLITPGKKCGRELFDAYAAMDVFAFSSQSETQGMVIAEAMAAGLPVVALNASGVREVVQNGKNGFLLDAKASEEEFATCLGKILKETKLREQLKVGAQSTAQKFSMKRSAKKALEFYEEIRKQTRRQRHMEKDEPWANLMKRIEVEWKLIADKAACAINALTGDEKKEETPKEEDALV
ncbi:MAG: glycosyltransferase, partial [Verrucomicrobiota bacterium]